MFSLHNGDFSHWEISSTKKVIVLVAIRNLRTIMKMNEKLKIFYEVWREWGINMTLKATLDYIGMKNYITIKYPKTDIEVIVRTKPFWKKLEQGEHEPHVFEFILNAIKEGQIIFDVGSWIGPYTLLFSKLVDRDGRVIAFEPSPSTFNILLDNLEKNNISNVTTENICLGNYVGKIGLRGSGKEASIVRWGETEVPEIVPCITIDKYCKDNDIVPDVIKIDVEGAEGLVIEGAKNIIKSYSPCILLEFHGNFFNEKERNECWNKITKFAKKIIHLNENQKYHSRCHVIIKY